MSHWVWVLGAELRFSLAHELLYLLPYDGSFVIIDLSLDEGKISGVSCLYDILDWDRRSWAWVVFQPPGLPLR